MGVQRPINNPHPSRAQLGFDAIVPESFADHCPKVQYERPS